MTKTKLTAKLGLEALRKLKWQNFLFLALAGAINAVGVTMFLAPVNLYDSGISGTSMLLWQVTPEQFNLSLFLVLLNVPLFLLGLKRQGWCFTVYSLFAVGIYSLVSFLITDVFPVDVANASPFAGQDLLLCAVFGGLISGAVAADGTAETLTCRSVSGAASLTLRSWPAEAEISTVSGGVAVRGPADESGFACVVSTVSGETDCGFDAAEEGGTYTLGAGEAALRISTTSGNVELAPLA